MIPSGARQDTTGHTRTKRISPGSLQRWLLYSIVGFVLFNGLAILHRLIFAPGDINNLKILGEASNILGWLVAIFFCLTRLPPHWWKKIDKTEATSPLEVARRRIPLWIAFAFSINIIERSAYLCYHILHTEPMFDWPDALLLLRYPFLLLAIFCLYRYALSCIARVRLAIDGFLILTALLAFSWYFLLGPLILQHQRDAFEKTLWIAYPLSDLLLCFYLFQLSFRNIESSFQTAWRLFVLGILGIVFADLFDVLNVLQARPLFLLMQSLLLCLGYILIALAVQAVYSITPEQYSAARSQNEEASHTSTFSLFLWRSLLPAVCVPAVLCFMVVIWATGSTGLLALGVAAAGIALIILLVVHQILVMYETFSANQALQRMQKEVYAKNYALAQANRRLEEQTHELKQANHLKDQFLLNVNHELRTPLTEMHGYLELLQAAQGSADARAQKLFLDHALNGSHELLRLVNTILEALRSEHVRETLCKEEFCVLAVVQEVVEAFDPRKREEYQLDLAIPAELTVYADRQHVRQILSNFLSNAFKYTPPRTTIEIGARSVPTANAPAQVQIWVQDQGPGIPPESIPFLFDKFFRLPRHQTSSIRGTGLGLYICKQLVEAMDGYMRVESSGIAGEGSRFSITLPASPV